MMTGHVLGESGGGGVGEMGHTTAHTVGVAARFGHGRCAASCWTGSRLIHKGGVAGAGSRQHRVCRERSVRKTSLARGCGTVLLTLCLK